MGIITETKYRIICSRCDKEIDVMLVTPNLDNLRAIRTIDGEYADTVRRFMVKIYSVDSCDYPPDQSILCDKCKLDGLVAAIKEISPSYFDKKNKKEHLK